jgi:hypothetical protein
VEVASGEGGPGGEGRLGEAQGVGERGGAGQGEREGRLRRGGGEGEGLEHRGEQEDRGVNDTEGVMLPAAVQPKQVLWLAGDTQLTSISQEEVTSFRHMRLV